jgi:fumarylacetoacetate (FAA) hydrolase
MRFATLRDGSRDGRLAVISIDHARALPVEGVATLQALLDDWERLVPACSATQQRVDAGQGAPFDPATAMAPLPRAWQWLDGSAYPSHGELMDQVLGIVPEPTGRPLMYQGLSDRFLSAHEDVAFPDDAQGIDFEGEFGVIVGDVEMNAPVEDCARAIRLIVQINDWSLRALAGPEMKTGFGWVLAKPACSMAPVAVTPDALGTAWTDRGVDLTLEVDWNGRPFGRARGGVMAWSFAQLIAHAAATRRLPAGTIIGSGTVSNANFRDVGSSCIAERRGIEIVDAGAATTGFMAFGDRIRMEARSTDGAPVFGAIDQRVVQA